MICWHCGKKLTSSKCFEIIKDQDGIEHKVHKFCYKYFKDEYKRLTADFNQEEKDAIFQGIVDRYK